MYKSVIFFSTIFIFFYVLTLKVYASPVGCKADYNATNIVDIADFGVFGQNYKRSGINCSLDITDADCYLGINDFQSFASVYKNKTVCQPETGNNFYVTSTGTSVGDGSQQNPWDFATAITRTTAQVPPGSTIWVGPGTYEAPIDPSSDYYKMFYINLTGAGPDQYVTLKAMPGPRPIIDGGVWIKNQWVIFWGFEVLMSSTNSRISQLPGSKPGDIFFGGGIRSDAKNIKVINNVVHDITGNGLISYDAPKVLPTSDQEWYGNIAFNNGWIGPASDRNHGHDVYSHNNFGGDKIFENNILLKAAALNVQTYSAGPNLIKDYVFKNNISVGGVFLIGGIYPASNIKVTSNYFYKSSVSMGYSAAGGSRDNKDAILSDNYIHLGNVANFIAWDQLTVTGNEFISSTALPVLFDSYGKSTSSYIWNNNKYYFSNAPTGYFKTKLDTGDIYSFYNQFGDWQSTVNLDLTGSSLSTTLPTTPKIVITPNKYEIGKAYMAVYNWGTPAAQTLSINLSSAGLTNGKRYRLRNVENYLSSTEFDDFTYTTGVNYNLSMSSAKWSSVPPKGLENYASDFLVSTYPTYGVFTIEPLD